MKVKQFTNSKGNTVKNQFIIIDGDKEVFQSYNSVIVVKEWTCNGHLIVKLDVKTWDYSVTTTKYRNQFLNETAKETQAKIDSGEYTLEDLN